MAAKIAWGELVRRVAAMDSWAVKVGVLKSGGGDQPTEGGEITMIGLAITHEFGLGVPERSFLRASIRERIADVRDVQIKLVRRIYAGEIEAPDALEILGAFLVGVVQDFIVNHPLDGDWALAPSTIEAKGSDRPLVDTGRLLQSITFEVYQP